MLVEFSEGAIKAAAHLKDLETQTGLTVETLAGFERVGKLSGNSIDEIAGASNRLNRALLTSGEQSNAAARAIQALGLNFDQFKHLEPDQQMLAVAEQMSKFRDSSEKGAAAMLLFGRGGAPFLQFLKELGERGAMTTAVTDEMAVSAKEFEDKLTELGFRTDDLKTRLGANLVPVLVEVVSDLLELQKQTNEWTNVLNPLTVVLQTVSVLGITVGQTFLGIGREIGAVAAQAALLAEAGKKDRTWYDWFGTRNVGETANTAAFTAISDAVKADGERAAKAADDAIARIMNAPGRAALLSNPAANADVNDRRLAALSANPSLDIPGAPGRGGADKTTEAQRYLDSLNKQLETQEKLSASEKAEIEITTLSTKAKSGLTDAIAAQIRAQAQDIDNVKTWQEYGKQQAEIIKKTTEAQIEQGKAHNAVIEAQLKETDNLRQSNVELERQNAAIGLDVKQRAALEQGYLDTAIAAKEYALQWHAVHDVDDQETASLQQQIDLLQQRQQLLVTGANKQTDLDNDKTNQKIETSMSDSLANGLLDGFRRGNSFADVFLNELKAQFAKTVLSPMIQPIVAAGNDAIKSGVGGFSSFLGSLFGGGGFSNTYGSGFSTNFTGDFLPTAGGMSGGGPVSAGSLRRVNELRTEGLNLNGQQFLLMGGQGGNIDNNPKVGGGGVQINQTLHVGQGVSRNELANAMILSKEQAKAEILRSQRHGGTFARAGRGG
jgi:hypothetical protein